MNAQLFDCDSAEWREILTRCSHDVYHTPAWLVASRHCDGGTGFALHVSDGVNDLLVPLIKRQLMGGLWDATSPYGYGGPVTNATVGSSFLPSAMSAAIACLRDHGCVSWFVRLHPLLNEKWQSNAGLIVNHGVTVSIDLRKSDEEHWRETMSGHRGDIKKALKAGIVVCCDKGFQRMDRFLDVYRASMDRLNASDYYYFDDAYFEDLTKGLADNLLLLLAEEDGVVIGASMFTVCRPSGIMQYHLSGTHPDFKHRQPSKLLLHAARAWGRENGLSRLHLGGGLGAAEDSLFKFKRGFSADTHAFRTQRIVVAAEHYDTLSARRGVLLDDSSGFFPLYRKPVPITSEDAS